MNYKSESGGGKEKSARPKAAWTDLLIPDINAVFRGRRVGADEFAAIAKGGMPWTASTFALRFDGFCVEESGIGQSVGDPDYPCRIIPQTFSPVIWHSPPISQAVFQMLDAKGDALFFGDPRAVLSRVLQEFSAMELVPILGVEFEFYLLKDNAPARPPSGGKQVYSMDDLDACGDFINRCFAAAKAQGISAESAVSESAPSQFEINLNHGPAMESCLRAILFRRLVRGVARSCGMSATFMAKPFAGIAGSGMHLHLSILDKKGRNIFAPQKKGGMSPKLAHAIAGALKIMGEGSAFFAPFSNSYRRFAPNSYMPLNATWAFENRTVAVRVPRADNDSAHRLEFRVAGADANPYLVAAALLAGAHYGIREALNPPKEGRGNCSLSPPDMPLTLRASLDSLKNAKILPPYLGGDFIRLYLSVKESEWRDCRDYISDYDILKFLPVI